MQLRGVEFAKFASESLLARKIADKGFSIEIASEDAEKDFGDGVIGHYECGHVYFRKGDDTCMLYQSRWSDNWAIDRNGARPPLVRLLADIVQMNDTKFVDDLMSELGLAASEALGASPAPPEVTPTTVG